jgi:hypothetical protein
MRVKRTNPSNYSELSIVITVVATPPAMPAVMSATMSAMSSVGHPILGITLHAGARVGVPRKDYTV